MADLISRIETSKALSDSLTYTYSFSREWLDNAASVSRLQGPGEWAIEIGSNAVRQIVNGALKRVDARRYTGPVHDASSKTGMRHSYEESKADVVHVETPTTGSVILTVCYLGKSAK